MQAVTITQITPNELEALIENSITKVLSIKDTLKTDDSNQWLDLNELVEYDPEKRTKATFYSYISDNKIPFHKPGKKLIFLKSEIDSWLKNGRVKTLLEIEKHTDEFLSNNKKAV